MRFIVMSLLLAGCLYPLHGKEEDDQCVNPIVEPAPVQLVNPGTLECQTFSQTQCNTQCGFACPAIASQPFPTWGHCDSGCRTITDQTACSKAAGCRVTLDFAKYYGNNAQAFDGCFPTDFVMLSTGPCTGLGADMCSMHHECAALYRAAAAGCAGCTQHQFAECIPVAQVAGSCGTATCASAPPACPTGTKPGVSNGCWTGSCIPAELCAPGH